MARSSPDRQAARTAVMTLHQALRVLRQYPGNAPLVRTALRRCCEALQAATAGAPLTLALDDGCLRVDGESMLTFAPADVPFGPLRHAGIAEIELAANVPAGDAEALVRRLASVTDDGDPERAAQALVGDGGLAHVTVHAATSPGASDGADAGDAWPLPPPCSPSPALQAFVARDVACNLPALAAQQYLDDAAAGCADGGAALARLLGRMLERRDVATASWLLAEVDHRTGLPEAARVRLRELAARTADDAWLRAQLEHGSRDELMNLAAFVMQLGDDVAARFSGLVAAAAHPFSRWLCELLRPGCNS